MLIQVNVFLTVKVFLIYQLEKKNILSDSSDIVPQWDYRSCCGLLYFHRIRTIIKTLYIFSFNLLGVSVLSGKESTCGITDRAAEKQSTALSYSPLRLKRTPRPHCSSGSTCVGSAAAALKNNVCTSLNSALGGRTTSERMD